MTDAGPGIKCLVVDDEPLAVRLLTSHIRKINSLELVASCKNAIQALEVLKTGQVDLLFLDIEMPKLSGLELLKSLGKPPKVIITTAYRQYALESYDLDVIDYLLKPIPFDRFLKSVTRFLENHHAGMGLLTGEEAYEQEQLFFIRDSKRTYRISARDILWLEGAGEYLKVVVPGKVHMARMTMQEAGNKLPAGEFLRIHKSYIVSLSKISSFTGNSVQVAGHELPIGRSFKSVVMKQMG